MSVSSGMDSPSPEARGTHATSMEAAAASETATSTTASKCIIGNQTCDDKNSCGQANKSIAKHGRPPDDQVSKPRPIGRLPPLSGLSLDVDQRFHRFDRRPVGVLRQEAAHEDYRKHWKSCARMQRSAR
jgi:hypothetical protein